jgi:Holliday junction resolvase RusA-like endonuclease
MKVIKKTVFNILPTTHLRITRGEGWILKSTEQYLQNLDSKKLQETGKYGGFMRRRRQMEKDLAYKDELQHLASKINFEMPTGYYAVFFYLPIPESWRKWKKEKHFNQPHQQMPDADNLIKKLQDSLMPRKNRRSGATGNDDRKIHCYAAFKIWCSAGDERVEIIEYDKDDFISKFL